MGEIKDRLLDDIIGIGDARRLWRASGYCWLYFRKCRDSWLLLVDPPLSHRKRLTARLAGGRWEIHLGKGAFVPASLDGVVAWVRKRTESWAYEVWVDFGQRKWGVPRDEYRYARAFGAALEIGRKIVMSRPRFAERVVIEYRKERIAEFPASVFLQES